LGGRSNKRAEDAKTEGVQAQTMDHKDNSGRRE
jgi:hypothetical protein